MQRRKGECELAETKNLVSKSNYIEVTKNCVSKYTEVVRNCVSLFK